MKAATIDMFNWIKQYNSSILYIAVFFCATMYIFVTNEELRKKLIIPYILLLVLLINPVLYKIIYSKLVYWRFFWILSDGIVISYFLTDIIKKLSKMWSKVVLTLLFVTIIVIFGECIYRPDVFAKIQNWQKVSKETQLLGNVMLSLDEYPTCVVPLDIACEIRQYSGNIESMYGRNSNYYINYLDEACMRVRQEIDLTFDYEYVFAMAYYHGYEFVTVHANVPVDKSLLEKYGYGAVYADGEYILYYNQDAKQKEYEEIFVVQYNFDDCDTFYTVESKNDFSIVGNIETINQEVLNGIRRSHADVTWDLNVICNQELSSKYTIEVLEEYFRDRVPRLVDYYIIEQ